MTLLNHTAPRLPILRDSSSFAVEFRRWFVTVLISAVLVMLLLTVSGLHILTPISTVPYLASMYTEYTPDIVTTDLMAKLLGQNLLATTHIALVQPIHTQSHWDASHHKIVTSHRLAVLQPLMGQLAPEIDVEVDGGYMANEQIGLWVSHGATLPQDAPSLLMLAADAGQFRVVGGEVGVFQIDGNEIGNDALDLRVPLSTFVTLFNRMTTDIDQTMTLTVADLQVASITPATISDSASALDPIPLDGPSGQSILDDERPRWIATSVELEVVVNLNSSQIDDVEKPPAAFYTSITRALRSWSSVESADFTLLYSGETDATATGYNGKNEILFSAEGRNRPLGQAQIWYTTDNVIVEVDIWLNDDYVFNVGDEEPGFGEIDLESVVLHELGHWVPLEHSTNEDAIMYSVLAPQQTKRNMHEEEIELLTNLYPCAVTPCIHPDYQSEAATPTMTATPDVLTPTATPTLVPTMATATLVPTISPASHEIYLPFVAAE